MGIEKWAIGEWKANKKLTQYYASQMAEYRQKLPIVFMKVEAHTGDFIMNRQITCQESSGN